MPRYLQVHTQYDKGKFIGSSTVRIIQKRQQLCVTDIFHDDSTMILSTRHFFQNNSLVFDLSASLFLSTRLFFSPRIILTCDALPVHMI